MGERGLRDGTDRLAKDIALLVDAPAQPIRDHHIAAGDGRRNDGRKRTEQHGALWGERGERGQRLAYVAQLGIEVILDE